VDNHCFQNLMLENAWMNLDSIFEDFEALIDAEAAASNAVGIIDETTLIRVHWLAGGFVDLVAPLLGQDFVAGMAIGGNDWQLVRLEAVERIVFRKINGGNLPRLRVFEETRQIFLERLPLPLAVSWSTQGEGFRARGILIEKSGSCLIIQVLGSIEPVGVPLASITALRIDSVENFGEAK
jgi:hypothetical protein